MLFKIFLRIFSLFLLLSLPTIAAAGGSNDTPKTCMDANDGAAHCFDLGYRQDVKRQWRFGRFYLVACENNHSVACRRLADVLLTKPNQHNSLEQWRVREGHTTTLDVDALKKKSCALGDPVACLDTGEGMDMQVALFHYDKQCNKEEADACIQHGRLTLHQAGPQSIKSNPVMFSKANLSLRKACALDINVYKWAQCKYLKMLLY